MGRQHLPNEGNYRSKRIFLCRDYLLKRVVLCSGPWAVNSGAGKPAKAIQRCLRGSADGAIGPMTLKAFADHNPEEIIKYVNDVRQKYYESLSTFDAFGRGWSARN